MHVDFLPSSAYLLIEELQADISKSTMSLNKVSYIDLKNFKFQFSLLCEYEQVYNLVICSII